MENDRSMLWEWPSCRRNRLQSVDFDACTRRSLRDSLQLSACSDPFSIKHARNRLSGRLSDIQTIWPAHFACAFCKRLYAQDAGTLQELCVWDFIQQPVAEESTEIA